MAQIFKGPKCQRAKGKGEEEYTAKEKGHGLCRALLEGLSDLAISR